MRKDEAYLYLNPEEGADPEEVYELKLFEFKQFFAGRFPVPRLFKSKLNALDKLNAAYISLGGVLDNVVYEEVSLESGNSLKESFDAYQKARNQIRQQIFMTGNGKMLVVLVENYLEITRQYAGSWSFTYDSLEGVKVSVETDVMELSKALSEFDQLGYVKPEEVIGVGKFEPVIAESKRLSLWLKMDEDGK